VPETGEVSFCKATLGSDDRRELVNSLIVRDSRTVVGTEVGTDGVLYEIRYERLS
jgi:hypothetical protein